MPGALYNSKFCYQIPWYLQSLPNTMHDIVVFDFKNNLCCMLFAVDQLKVNVVRVYVGSLMTSLEMAGVSLTLLHMVPGLQWEELLGNFNFIYLK